MTEYCITRKRNGNIIAHGIEQENIDNLLRVMVPGVYAIESMDGVELSLAVVKGGKVRYD